MVEKKQRIAFLKQSKFYILDDSTSNLDFATENIIVDVIYNRFRDIRARNSSGVVR